MEDAFSGIQQAINRFQPLDPEEWQALKEGLVLRHFDRGDFLIREGAVENHIYFLNRGATRHFFIRDGKDFTVDFRFEGDFVTAYYSLITREPSAVFIQLLAEAEVVAVSARFLQAFYARYPHGERVGRLMAESQYIRRLRKEMDLLSLTAEERFAALMQRDPGLVGQISVKHLSSYLGIQPESLSRIRRQYRGS